MPPMSISDADRSKARQRLALRAERAFGLNSVRLAQRSQDAVAPQDETHDPPAEVHPADGPETRDVGVSATPTSGGVLFGAAVAELRAAPPAFAKPAAPFTSEILSSEEKRLRLQQLEANEVRGCTKCRLCEARTHTVFGEGSVDAKIFFVGEGPGENEDLSGRPFVGRAGDLLNKQIAAMGLRREDVMVANVVKCRPPQNRTPSPDEAATCMPYLERQIEIVRPQVIVTLGLSATRYMLSTNSSMGRLRGQWHAWRGIKVMPTFHPAYLLRSYTDANRAMVWSDLQAVMRELNLPMPKRGSA
jgi:DNA polymerase